MPVLRLCPFPLSSRPAAKTTTTSEEKTTPKVFKFSSRPLVNSLYWNVVENGERFSFIRVLEDLEEEPRSV